MTSGKNFSGVNRGQRKVSDFYETPYSMTKQLLDVEEFDGITLEPACGNGAILKVLRGICWGFDKEQDFLLWQGSVCNIVTNPPFSLAFEFIQYAKQVTRRKIAMLLPLSYLHGKRRLDEIYNDQCFPLARIYVFCRYPMLGETLREDGKYNTGMMVYAWYIWDKSHVGEPVIRWIDNQPFILGKHDK